MPSLAHLGEHRSERNRLRRRVIVNAETDAVACHVVNVVSRQTLIMLTMFASFQTGMQAMTDIGQEAADMNVDIIFLHHLGGLLTGDSRRAFVVGNYQFDRTAVDAAIAVDAVNRHLQADQCGLAAGGAGAGQRLL